MRHLLSRGRAQSCGPQSQCIASDLGAQPRRYCRVSNEVPAPAVTRSSRRVQTVGRRSNRGDRNGVAPECAPAEKRRASCQKLAKRTTENHGRQPERGRHPASRVEEIATSHDGPACETRGFPVRSHAASHLSVSSGMTGMRGSSAIRTPALPLRIAILDFHAVLAGADRWCRFEQSRQQMVPIGLSDARPFTPSRAVILASMQRLLGCLGSALRRLASPQRVSSATVPKWCQSEARGQRRDCWSHPRISVTPPDLACGSVWRGGMHFSGLV
jgi:hypothetical protein